MVYCCGLIFNVEPGILTELITEAVASSSIGGLFFLNCGLTDGLTSIAEGT